MFSNMSIENPSDFDLYSPENAQIDSNSPANDPNPADAGASGTIMQRPYLEIIEQPAQRSLRFRYLCEITSRHSAGSIYGVNDTQERRTYPTIRIVNYQGPVVVIVSLVTSEEPYRAHPHKLVGRDCKDGICFVEIDVPDNMTRSFPNLGIMCVTKREIKESLETRKKIQVDPFGHEFAHMNEASSINLISVRLCFQAFLRGYLPTDWEPLTPVVSDVIYDKKNLTDLVITRISHCSAPAHTPTDIILLCEKVVKEDIQILFTEEIDGKVAWQGFGEFNPSQVHKQFAINFMTPKYTGNTSLAESVNVSVHLLRPSDGAISKPYPFKFTPEWHRTGPTRPLPPQPQPHQLPVLELVPRPQFELDDVFFRELLSVPSMPPMPSTSYWDASEQTRPSLMSESSQNVIAPSPPGLSVLAEEPDPMNMSIELFPANPSMYDPLILDEMLTSANMNQASNNIEQPEEPS